MRRSRPCPGGRPSCWLDRTTAEAGSGKNIIKVAAAEVGAFSSVFMRARWDTIAARMELLFLGGRGADRLRAAVRGVTSMMMMVADTPKEPNWLAAALGKEGAPAPPPLNSGRIKDMLSRALLQPGSLSAVEVQELAASVLSHLVNLKED